MVRLVQDTAHQATQTTKQTPQMKATNKSTTTEPTSALDKKGRLLDLPIGAAKAKKKPATKKAPAKAKAKVTKPAPKATKPAPKAKVVAPVAPPPVAPVITLPKDVPAPQEIELVKDGDKGKRYVSKTAPDSKFHLRDRSESPKPVSIVRKVCEANPNLTRKEIILLCLDAGVNKNTAATQYSLWKAKRNAVVVGGEDEGEE
jgi:hypothetical protein